MRGLIRRTPECALHVHVGMPDPETARSGSSTALRAHLPLLQALGGELALLVRRGLGPRERARSRSCAPIRAAGYRASFSELGRVR